MIIEPEWEYKKSPDGKRALLKRTRTIPENMRKNGYEFVEPTRISYSEFNKETGICDLKITEDEVNSGATISKEEFFALMESLKEKEKAVA